MYDLNKIKNILGNADPKKITSHRKYYPPEIMKIKEDLSIGDDISSTDILGSYSFKLLNYYADIDMFQTVRKMNKKSIKKAFQNIIKKILGNNKYFFSDCKLGIDETMRIIDETSYVKNGKIYGYDYDKSLQKLESIYSKKWIDKDDYDMAKKLLKKKPTAAELNMINKKLRFHILRWNPKHILQGYLLLPNGKKYDFMKAITENSLFKLDTIILINDVFREVTIIYDIRDKKGYRINSHNLNFIDTLKDDINTQMVSGEYFKALKRKFSLNVYEYDFQKKRSEERKNKIIYLFNVINGDLGKLKLANEILLVINDLISNHEKLNVKKISGTINFIIDMLSRIVDIDGVPKIGKNSIIKELTDILSMGYKPNITNKLSDLYDKLQNILNNESKKYLSNK